MTPYLETRAMPTPRTVEKAYAYVTRPTPERELLVFRNSWNTQNPEKGLQVPKGTVEDGEDPDRAVLREVYEESGIEDAELVAHLTTDRWPHETKPKVYRRHFYHLQADESRDEWRHTVTGGGEDDGEVYAYTWVDPRSVDLARDMDDYVDRVFDGV